MFGDVTETWEIVDSSRTVDSMVEPELTRGALEKSLKSKENKNMRGKLYFEFYRV